MNFMHHFYPVKSLDLVSCNAEHSGKLWIAILLVSISRYTNFVNRKIWGKAEQTTLSGGFF